MIYWSMQHGNGTDIIYYAYANDDFTDLEGTPKQLFFPKNGKSCIDRDIIYKNGIFHLFYKTEGHGNGIRKAMTDHLTSGCWIEQPDYKQQTRHAVEGSSVFKLTNQEKYILLYDVFDRGEYQFCESVDLDNFRVIDHEISMDFKPRHGTVIPVTQKELEALTLGNETFHNLHIFEGQDWENQTRTILLTGLDEEVRSVWGKQTK